MIEGSIREAQKHVDPVDPDPFHCIFGLESFRCIYGISLPYRCPQLRWCKKSAQRGLDMTFRDRLDLRHRSSGVLSLNVCDRSFHLIWIGPSKPSHIYLATGTVYY
jgi:hypothetical protein